MSLDARSAFVDPRVRMRDALRALVQQDPEAWHEPSLAIFRNRLLDITGSDARPLAELLLEAEQRGWRDRLPRERLAPSQWDALSASFVMRWSAERFVQPEMAQWAAESWGLALDVIGPTQLRIAPPLPPAPPRSSNGASAPTAPGNSSATNAAATRRGAATSRQIPSRTYTPPPVTTRRMFRTRSRAPNAYQPSVVKSTMAVPDPRLVWTLAGAAALSYVFFLARITFSINDNRKAAAHAGSGRPNPRLAPLPTVAKVTVGDSAKSSDSTLPPTLGVEQVRQPTVLPSTPLATLGYKTVTSAADTTSAPSPTPAPAPSVAGGKNPGVPSVTRSLLDQRIADPNRMMYVEPPRRATGTSVPVATPETAESFTFDEVFFNDGTTMRGRVEVVRAGTVIFRDLRTGLRHELRKDDIDHMVSEFGSTVRFRAADLAPGAKSAAAAKSRIATGVRSRGVGGAYVVRYAAAQAVGSPECTDVWTRPPNAIDRATVRHIAGADTLSIAFEGGDNFPSNIDPDGYFASTFRIVPDQARTSTALTTRLTGQFKTDGSLALQVSIVFFRRMREGRDITCTVNIKADGKRGEK
jgi:hypothetical protein